MLSSIFYFNITIVGEIAKLFPNLFGQPSVSLLPGYTSGAALNHNLKIGVVLSGGQAPGGHNVISGIFGECFHNTLCLCIVIDT